MGPESAAYLVPIAFVTAVGWVVYVMAQARTRREAQRAELHAKLLERVGSAREFGEFLGSAAGERFLQALTPEPPRNRLVVLIRIGAFAVVFGLILLVANFWRLLGSQGDDLRTFAILVLAVGVALLVAAALSHAVALRLGLGVPADRTAPPQP
jgi:hypothetical protein